MWMVSGYVLVLITLWSNVKMTAAVAAYYAVWASCTCYLAYELSVVFCWMLHKKWDVPHEVFPAVLLLVGTVGVVVCRYTVAIWIPEDKRFSIGPRQLTSALVLLAMQGYLFLWFVRQCTGGTHGFFTGRETGLVFCRCRLYVLSCCIYKMNYSKKVRCGRNGWFRIFSGGSKRTLPVTKENIDIINRKCHDLKHQISALRDMCTKEEREKYITEIQDSIQIYEAMVKNRK